MSPTAFTPAKFLKICFEVPVGTDSSTAVGDDITLGNDNQLRNTSSPQLGVESNSPKVEKDPLKREASGEICRRSAILEEGNIQYTTSIYTSYN